jgi:hypothetical protein
MFLFTRGDLIKFIAITGSVFVFGLVICFKKKWHKECFKQKQIPPPMKKGKQEQQQNQKEEQKQEQKQKVNYDSECRICFEEMLPDQEQLILCLHCHMGLHLKCYNKLTDAFFLTHCAQCQQEY